MKRRGTGVCASGREILGTGEVAAAAQLPVNSGQAYGAASAQQGQQQQQQQQQQ